MSKFKVYIGRDGELKFLHSDRLFSALKGVGPAQVDRASFVEPLPDGSGWTADMSPVGVSVVLGPFPSRARALEAEAAWLEVFLSGGPA